MLAMRRSVWPGGACPRRAQTLPDRIWSAMFSGGIPVGRYFGISVRLHYSWFIVFALVTWALAAGYFPQEYPNWSLTSYWGIGVATSLLFFISVLLHELAHSIVAQAAGIQIESITLFILGGVSQMTKEPEKPGVEFRMAVAGPLSSLLISGVFWGIWAAARGFNEELTGLAFWLGWINLVLAGFNLIPGFPLDGGRVLRAIVWWRSGNLLSATRTASNIGRAFGYLFIFGGIWWVFWGNWINGLWLAFVGWFLQGAAAGSYRQLAVQDMLRGHKVGEVMMTDCPSIPPGLSVEQLVNDHVLALSRRCFPVTDGGHMVGLVTVHDVRKVPLEGRATKTVGEVMTAFDKLRWVRPDDELSSVFQILTGENINQVPVVEDGRIVGMVARDNLLEFIRIHSELRK